ncbi:TonB-system energizer ExbB [Sulfurimonas sp. MAG313]|nr:TonB-system energizer ExbB [Sulfurimonas sp. MAG313]MDF1880150.1 TonB-system energizer ExbB [Sulfurimonas sp. MAG313]
MQASSWTRIAEQGIDYGIIGLLIFMSILALWVYVERIMFYKTINVAEHNNREKLELDLSDNVSTVATITVNAPYVGLLGTVLGIMITFYTLGETGAVDTKQIMGGLALALKATAMGLLVAIPSGIFYNVLLRKMERILAYWDIEHNVGAKD